MWANSTHFKMKFRLALTFCCVITLTNSCTLYRSQEIYEYPSDARVKRDLTTNCGPDDEIPPNRVNTTQNLWDLRNIMEQFDVDAYYVPLDNVGRRTWISGFSGSNGDAIVTKDRALAWTDGRYFLQAANQLDCNWELMKMGLPEVQTYTEFLSDLSPGSIVGCDPTLMGAKTWLKLNQSLAENKVILKSFRTNFIDEIWTEENGRPPVEGKLVTPFSIQYAGLEWPQKVQNLRETLKKSNLDAMAITEHDEIAWLFNLRGQGESTNEGLMHSPLFESLALVSDDQVFLWIDTQKVVPGLMVHLNPRNCDQNNTCTVIGDISESLEDLESWSKTYNKSILLTTASTYLTGASFAVYESISNSQFKDSPVMIAKNVKNEIEAQGMINSHLRDAVALCQFSAHLEESMVNGTEGWTELTASKLLADYRAKQDLHVEPSFTTIAAFGPNSAVIHYTPSQETDAQITTNGLFLVDSGGQYLDGTTDVTRTFHYGKPTDHQIEMYTRVLMGAIDLASVIIPKNTQDGAVDLATRQHLFDKGLNFRHGTGHGIGAYLKVHEGPINVHMHSGSESRLTGKFAHNMFFSDEPGYYEDGNFGIRLETILRVVAINLTDTTYGEFVRFEPVTLVPFEPKLIDFELMSTKQIENYNTYNEKIINQVLPLVQDERTRQWIESRTQYVSPAKSYEVQKWRDEI